MKLPRPDAEMVARAAFLHEVSGMSVETAATRARSEFSDEEVTLTAQEVEKRVRRSIQANEPFFESAEPPEPCLNYG